MGTNIHAGELVVGVTYLFFVFPNAFFWTCVHVYKMYLDLYTKDRKSVSIRRNKPTITPLYTKMTWLTTGAVIIYFLTMFISTIGSNFNPMGPGCEPISAVSSSFWLMTKPFPFLTYILRLHQCYSLSVYGYGKQKLIFIAMFIIIIYGIFFIVNIVGVVTQDEIFYLLKDSDTLWPHNCSTGREPGSTIGFVVGGGVIIFDLIFSIGSIIAFVIPINRLHKQLKSLAETSNSTAGRLNNEKTKKMLSVGYKYKVCVACASISSIIWILFAIAGQPVIYGPLTGIDFTINMFCLMLMTPYYPDDKYYQRLCYLCICCCDCKKQSYHSKASPENRDNQEPTITGLDNSVVSTNLSSSPGLSNSPDIASPSTNAQRVDTMGIVRNVANSNDNDNVRK